MSLVILNFDGFIIPYLVKTRMITIKKQSIFTKILVILCLLVFILGGLAGFGHEIYSLIYPKKLP